MARSAWLAIWTDPGREPHHVVWLDKAAGLESVAGGISEKAKSDLADLDWDEEDAEKLRKIIIAHAENRHEDVLDLWEDWRTDKEPLDEDVEFLEVEIGE